MGSEALTKLGDCKPAEDGDKRVKKSLSNVKKIIENSKLSE